MKDKRLKATARLLEVMNTLRRECPWDLSLIHIYTRGSALIVHESQRAPPPCLYVEIANHLSALFLQIYAVGS